MYILDNDTQKLRCKQEKARLAYRKLEFKTPKL